MMYDVSLQIVCLTALDAAKSYKAVFVYIYRAAFPFLTTPPSSSILVKDQAARFTVQNSLPPPHINRFLETTHQASSSAKMSSTKKLLTVFGATGNQGGSLIRTILKTPSLNSKYALRGVTRDTSKAAAQELAKQGVDVVRADLDDPASLQKAISGSHGVFAVTNFWESMDGAKETQQGKNIVDASISTGVNHLVISSLHNVNKLTNGALHVPHFDSKAAIDDYAESVRADKLNVTYFHPAFFSRTSRPWSKRAKTETSASPSPSPLRLEFL